MKELTSAFMKKHLRLFNKMVRAETYKDIAKMKAERVREIFNRDFREIVSGKDGKTFYAPKKYQIDLDQEDEMTPILKQLSKDLKINKPKEEKAKPKPKTKKAEVTLKKLVIIAHSHKKNGISPEGLKAFFNLVTQFKSTNPPKLESQVAGALYNYLQKNILLGKKRMPNNLNKSLKELGLRTL
jgi:hypothetical protein